MSQIIVNPALDSAIRPSTQSRFSEMSSEDFIRVIFAELAHQDPFAPNDSSALLEQLSSIRAIESDLELSERFKSLVSENQFALAANLIGKDVTGLTEDNFRVSGRVAAVRREGQNVTLQLDTGWLLPIGLVESVTEASPSDPPGG